MRLVRALLLSFLLASPASAWVIQHTLTTSGGGGSSCGSSTLATDTFTEAGSGNIALTAHTKDSGGSWTNSNGLNATNGFSLDRANDVVLSTSAGSNGTAAVVDDTVTCYDYDVSMTARTGATGSNRIGPLARADITTGNGYWLRLTGGGAVELYIVVAGSADIQLCSETVSSLLGSFSTSTNYTLKMTAKGTALTASINDTEVCSVTDSTYSTGKPGIKTTNTNPRGDNFSSTYLP